MALEVVYKPEPAPQRPAEDAAEYAVGTVVKDERGHYWMVRPGSQRDPGNFWEQFKFGQPLPQHGTVYRTPMRGDPPQEENPRDSGIAFR